MKTNLDKFFASNEDAELNGRWVELAEDVAFKLKRFGGKNAQKIKMLQARYLKPYARQIEKGLLDDAKERSIYVNIFVDSCVVDWKGVIDSNDNEVQYSRENAVELFNNLPDLFDFVVAQATSDENYREDLGNS